MNRYIRGALIVVLCAACRSATEPRAHRVMTHRCRAEYRGSGGYTHSARTSRKEGLDAAVIAPAPVNLHPTPGTTLGRSAGCGLPARDPASVFKTFTIATARHERVYHLRLPDRYDPQRAYPLIFRLHGSGGTGRSGGLSIERVSGKDAIIVAPDGLEQSWEEWTRDDDLAMFDELLTRLGARTCIDLDRVYAYGFSAGAAFAHTLACKRGHLIRAIAAIAGSAPEPPCEGQVASWLMHDVQDDAVPFAEGQAAKERLRIANGCSHRYEKTRDGCVRYADCNSEAPVVWCETRGLGHNVRGDYAPFRAWEFFSSLPR